MDLFFLHDDVLIHFHMRLQMMLYGAIFGCLSPVLSVAAFLSYKSPFLSPKDEVYVTTMTNNL
jgi:hypothetical protein